MWLSWWGMLATGSLKAVGMLLTVFFDFVNGHLNDCLSCYVDV